MANVIDQILGMNGAITYTTVLFYIANEGLSILENMAELGVLVPTNLAEKLKVIENKDKSFAEEVQDELTGQNINDELKNKSGA